MSSSKKKYPKVKDFKNKVEWCDAMIKFFTDLKEKEKVNVNLSKAERRFLNQLEKFSNDTEMKKRITGIIKTT